MQEERLNSVPLRFNDPRTEAVLEPEEVSAILRLNELGWGGQTDCPRTRDQPQHGQGLHRGRRLDAVPTTAAQKEGIDPVRSYQEGPRVSIRSTARCAAPLCEMQRPAGVEGHITCKRIAPEAGSSLVWPSASRERDGPHREESADITAWAATTSPMPAATPLTPCSRLSATTS